jgi:ABC-type glycerol-3-phosphate transport system permease component
MSDNERTTSAADPSPSVQWFAIIMLFVLLAVVLTPWAWAIISSFKVRGDIMSAGLWPREWVLHNYRRLFAETYY